MRRSPLLRWILLAGVSLLLGAYVFRVYLSPRLNVVVVVVDTLRRDHLATYGLRERHRSFPGERRSLLGTAEGDRRLGDRGKAAAKLFNEYSRGALPRSEAAPGPQLAADLAANGYLAAGAPVRMRGIPRRIAPPDTSPDGRLGWESAREAPACADLKEPASKRLTLAGWYSREPGGRWTAPDATLLLGSPAGGPARLELRGINHRPEPARLRVALGGKPVLDQEVATGPFRIEEPLSRTELLGPVLLRLATTPPFVPAQHGSADPRTLGLFFESICLR